MKYGIPSKHKFWLKIVIFNDILLFFHQVESNGQFFFFLSLFHSPFINAVVLAENVITYGKNVAIFP